MRKLKISLALILAFSISLYATENFERITTEYIKSEFRLTSNESVKYSKCIEKRKKTTCTYVWGEPSSKDKTRVKLGLTPQGNKLLIIYVQAKDSKDFKRVASSYSDAKSIDNIGTKALYSAKRKQLSYITKSNQIVHVHLDATNVEKVQQKIVTIAKYIERD